MANYIEFDEKTKALRSVLLDNLSIKDLKENIVDLKMKLLNQIKI